MARDHSPLSAVVVTGSRCRTASAGRRPCCSRRSEGPWPSGIWMLPRVEWGAELTGPAHPGRSAEWSMLGRCCDPRGSGIRLRGPRSHRRGGPRRGSRPPHTAGVAGRRPRAAVIDVNLRAFAHLTREFLPYLRGGGPETAIVAIASVEAWIGQKYLSRLLCLEVGPAGSGPVSSRTGWPRTASG